MKRKSDLSLRIGMVMMLLCTVLVLTVLPAAADYTADKPLTEKYSGTVTGDMNYTIGDSYYSPKMWSNESYVYSTTIPETIPNDTTVVRGRLYVYWTWSYNATNGVNQGVAPEMDVKLNGQTLTRDVRYTDSKGSGTYNYPSGTDCYDVTNYLSTGTNNYVVNITNNYGSAYSQSFNIQAVGLLVLYDIDESTVDKYYWIDEGCDLTNAKYTAGAWENGIKPSDATCLAKFSGVDNSSVTSARLITVAPATGTPTSGTIYNRFYFNDNYWNSFWDGNPRDSNFSWETTDIASYLLSGDNWAKFRNGWDDSTYYTDGQMQAANAFLLLE